MYSYYEVLVNIDVLKEDFIRIDKDNIIGIFGNFHTTYAYIEEDYVIVIDDCFNHIKLTKEEFNNTFKVIKQYHAEGTEEDLIELTKKNQDKLTERVNRIKFHTEIVQLTNKYTFSSPHVNNGLKELLPVVVECTLGLK